MARTEHKATGHYVKARLLSGLLAIALKATAHAGEINLGTRLV